MAAMIERLFREGRLTGSWLAALVGGEPIPRPTLRTDPAVPCTLCGYAFTRGELGHENPTRSSVSFNDGASMRASAGSPACSGCVALFSSGKRYMQALSQCVVSADGIWSIASNERRSWWLLNPPTPPFVMVCSVAQQQHLYWRTPVATSRAIYPVRVGPHVGLIRRDLLLRAFDMLAPLASAMRAPEPVGSRPPRTRAVRTTVRPSHPYVRLDRILQSPLHGLLKPDALATIRADDAPADFAVFETLNLVERWALGALANQKTPLTSAPAPDVLPPWLRSSDPQAVA